MNVKNVIFFLIIFLSISFVSKADDNIVESFLKGFTGATQKVLTEPIIKNIEKRHHVNTGLVKYNADDDMPPEEHRDMWGRVESKKGNCWVHVKTFKKICD